MVRWAQLGTQAKAALAAGALVASGLLVPVLMPAQALGAEAAPMQQRQSAVPTADALPTAQMNGVAWTQLVVGNTVYVGGSFTKARPAGMPLGGAGEVTRNNLLAYDLTTGDLLPFAPNLNQQVRALAKSPDGTRLYVGGNFTSADGGAGRYRIAAYNMQTGSLVSSWSPGVDYTVSAIVATDSTVYVGGAFTNAGGQPRTRLAAFAASNGALLSWAPTADNSVLAMVLSPDGTKLIAGGSFTNVNASPQRGVVALDPTTGAVLPFATNERVTNGGTNSAILSLSIDGTSLYGGGYKFGSGGNLEGMFKADLATGQIQWVEDCHGDTYGVYASANAVFQVGHSHYCGNNMGWPQPPVWNFNRATAFSKDATGTLIHEPLGYSNWANTPAPSLISWFPRLDVGTFTGKNQAAWTVTGNDDYVVLGGEFPLVNGVAQQGLARFAIRPLSPGKMGGELSGSNFRPTLTATAPGAVRISFLANWDRDDRNLTYKIIRNGASGTPIYTTTADSAEFERPALGFTDTGLTPGQTYNYRLQVTDGDGNITWGDGAAIVASGTAATLSSYSQTVLDQGASLYWPLNDLGTAPATDKVGYNDGEVHAGVTRNAAGVLSGDAAMTFSGASGGEVASSGSLFAPITFTAEAWFKTTSTRGGRIIGFSDLQAGTSGHRDRQIYLNNAGRVSFGVWANTQQSAVAITSAASFNDGSWHQAVATMGANGMVLYVDGLKVGSRTDVTTTEKYVGYWRVGGDSLSGYGNAGSSGWLAGSIDEVSVYPTALSTQQINAQYAAAGRTSPVPSDAYGAAVFQDEPTLYWRLGETSGITAADTAGLNPGGYQGTTIKGVAGAITGTTDSAVTFNGSNGYVSSNASFANPTIYSVEAWVKTTSTAGGKVIGFGSSRTGLSTNYDRHLYMQNDGKVVFGAQSASFTVTSPTALNDGQWHYVVGTQGPDGMTLYVDGLPVGTNAQTTPASYTGYWRVGGDRTWGSSSSYLNGTIDEAAVYPRSLSAATVKSHFAIGGGLLANVLPAASFTHVDNKMVVSVDGSGSADSDGTINEYAWNFGDGGTATGLTATHNYSTVGQFTVTLVVTDNRGGSATTTRSVTTVANQLPAAAFTVTQADLKSSFNASTSTDPDGTIASYAWDFGDGTAGTGALVTHDYLAGTYQAVLTVEDNSGGVATTTQQVIAVEPPNAAPVAAFVLTPNKLMVGVDASTSTDSDGTVAGYSWDFGDGATATGVTSSHTYAAAGLFTITLSIVDDQGGVDIEAHEVAVVANSVPTASVTSSSNGPLLTVDGSLSSDADGSISSYAWDFGDGGTGTGATATHTYAGPGSFTVTLTVTDNDGAKGTVSSAVTLTAAVSVSDQFARVVANGWGTAEIGGAWTIGSGPAGAAVTGGYGLLPGAKGGTRIASLNSAAPTTDSELAVVINLDKMPTGGATMVSAAVRKTAAGEYRLTAYFSTSGAVTLQLNRISGGVATTLKSQVLTGLTYTAGADLSLKFQVLGTTSVTFSAKGWLSSTAEPAGWQAIVVDAAPPAALQGPGVVSVMSYISGNATNAPVTAGFKAFTVKAPTA